jgi:hypothetical protein
MTLTMRGWMPIVLLFPALTLAPLALAQEEPETPDLVGKDRAIEAILESLARMEIHFAELLEKVPEQARPGIERALQANREGRMKALDALGYVPPEVEAGAATALTAERPGVPDIQPQIKTPDDAVAAITDGRMITEGALADVRNRLPEPARPDIDRALVEVRRGTEEALAAMRNLPARPERPELPPVERPQALPRPERPDRPGR